MTSWKTSQVIGSIIVRSTPLYLYHNPVTLYIKHADVTLPTFLNFRVVCPQSEHGTFAIDINR